MRCFTNVLTSALAMLLAVGFAFPSIVNAKSSIDIAKITWKTQAVESPNVNGPLPLEEKQSLLFTRIYPVGSLRSTVAIESDRALIPAGTTFVASNFDARLYCEPIRRMKQSDMYCVADADKDDFLETIYLVKTMEIDSMRSPFKVYYTYLDFFIGAMTVYSGKPLSKTLPRSILVPDDNPPTLEIMFSNRGKQKVALCTFRKRGSWLTRDNDGNFCGQEWSLKNLNLPLTIATNSGRISISRASDGFLQAELVPPPQGTIFPKEQ